MVHIRLPTKNWQKIKVFTQIEENFGTQNNNCMIFINSIKNKLILNYCSLK
jgi:hypothetical protein